MKIEKVVIQNLNSIEEAEIDFSNGVLANEPLFLICGETGSGKSTILDAITLALYDKASRYESVKNKESIGDKRTTQDTSNILRNGKYDGKAEVHFSVNNIYYIATWLIHKTKSNTYDQKNRRKLEIVSNNIRTVICSKIAEVNNAIVELIGLTYEQFVRSVMLAQGEFSTFLKSKKNEQSEILEMLTGTEVYSQIAESIKNKKGEAFYKRKDAETLFNSLKCNILSEEDIENLNIKKEEFIQSIIQKENELKKLESYLNWLKKNNDLQKEYNECKLLCDDIVKKINSSEYKENQSVINDYFATSKEREAFKEMKRLESELCEINDNIDDDIRLFINLIDSLNYEKKNKDNLIQKLDELKKWLDTHEDDKVIAENLNLIIGCFDDISQANNFLIEKEQELLGKTSKKNDVASQIQLQSQYLENVKKSKQEAERSLEKLLKDFNSEEYQNLIDEQQKLDNERKHCLERNSKLTNVRTVLEQYLELSQNVKNEKDKCDNIKQLFNKKNDAFIQIKSTFETKDLEFHNQKEMVDDWAKEYRSKLKDGEPCPVCGSKEHYYKDENVVHSLFASIENEWKKTKESYENAKDELNKLETELKLFLRNINSEERKLELLLNNLNNLCNDNPVFEIERIDANIKKYNDLIINYDQQILNNNEKLKNITSVKKNIDEAQNNIKYIDEDYHLKEKQLSDKQIEYQQIELQLNTIDTIIKEKNAKLTEKVTLVNKYVKIENWKETFLKTPNDFIKHINKIATELQTKKDLIKKTEDEINKITEILEQCHEIGEKISDVLPKKSLYMMTEKYPLQDLVSLFTALYTRSDERLRNKNAKETNYKNAKSIIDDFIFKNQDFTDERLKFISKIDDIQSYVLKNKSLDDELIKVTNTLSIKVKELESHQKSEFKPNDDVTSEELEKKIISLNNEKKYDEENLSEVNLRLSMNAENTSKHLEYQKDFEEKDRIYNLWDQLAKAIGTTEGNNFRDVAQSYTMGILLDRANYYLRQLSNRYLLSCYPDSLAIMVSDMEMGGEQRTASSLSGGETFLVSLSLALGLTSLNDEHFNMDMLFIDEGFGTLDNESLDMVMNTLENLHTLGRKVGIISHVDTLKERIPVKIQLVREGKSASRVEVIRN